MAAADAKQGDVSTSVMSTEKKSNDNEKQKIVICGGGNASHVFLGLSAVNRNNEVFLFSTFQTEAQDFKDKIITNDNKLTLELTQTKSKIEAYINPDNITKDPSCLKNADIVIISLPAFAHAQYLKEIASHLGDTSCLIGMFPGASGLECDWQHIINNEKSCPYGSKYTLISCITLPWACRIKEYGQVVEVLGTKASVRVSAYPKYSKPAVDALGVIIGELPVLVDYGHVINMSLGATNAIIHPSILYDKWVKWDGAPVRSKPLFYQGITKNGAQLLSDLSDETILITESIKKESNIDTIQCRQIYEAYKLSYGAKCKDASSLHGIITTNPAYEGLTHPCVEHRKEDGGNNDDEKGETLYVPNFKYRYLSEDIPYGLIVIKGIALLLKDVPKTPQMDKVIQWAQKVMKKEYLIYNEDGTVVAGKDIQQTRAPQKYGFDTIQQLL
eukprot:266075_1